MRTRVFSFGGGVQSMAVMVLAAQRRVRYDFFLFSNAGEDSEHPQTLAYMRDVVRPFAARNGLDLIELTQDVSIHRWLMEDNRSICIPMRLASGRPGRQTCTEEWKIRPIAKWLREGGVTKKEPATVGLGVSLDEDGRARKSSGVACEVLEYPLLDLGLDRRACVKLIESAGLPVPHLSACWFCPFQSMARWRELRRDFPELFERACKLEDHVNAKRAARGRDVVRLHHSLKPLAEACEGDQHESAFDACKSGYCLT